MYNNNNDNNNNSCQKFPIKTVFAGAQLTDSESKRTVMKKAVLHTTILMHIEVR